MVIFAALVIAAAPGAQEPRAVTAERQAVAMVRILPGAQVRFSQLEKIAPESFSDARIRDTDGSSRPARLVEFQ
jgi:hypothetical protein